MIKVPTAEEANHNVASGFPSPIDELVNMVKMTPEAEEIYLQKLQKAIDFAVNYGKTLN